ncbi:cobaltochelatase subunit CobN [Pseudothauera nasutitermitis]|uniref:Cobaltochelatase subunit CobN n=1 Tax=Pseudothauera nasutitermitis TaxID=2565930 RepID=A0A4S4B854_9RHOO|nr:cobaltochelatase subunit CobN [Pseudothauera nasutitermitis]THF67193.1 cobaltochelatase subunit CobN [Pseudothauera nasutitermitis]
MSAARFTRLLGGGLLAGLLCIAPALADSAPVVQVVHNRFVSAEKFQRLQTFAQQEGVTLRHLDVETSSADDLRQALAATSLAVLDVPRPNDRAMVEQRAEPAAPAGLRRLTVGGGRPAWENLPPAQGGALAALYDAGGADNFRRFFALARMLHAGLAPPPHLLEPPARLPATAFYHPQAPRLFEHLEAYLAWHASHAGKDAARQRGRVAFLLHRGVVADLLTREVDELIARSEAAGLQPVAFWFDGSAPDGLAAVLGAGQVDALVNLSHMQNGAARSRDFLALDVPVLQALRFREGAAADWPAAVSGVAPRTTAVFLAGPEGWGISDPLVLSAATAGVENLLPEQADALIAKLQSLVALRHRAPADKKLALMFWNYPVGEKNLGASNLNIPRSIVSIQAALAAEGYAVGEALDEQQVIEAGQRMLGALYGSVTLDALLAEGKAGLYPLADYERWLAALPPARRAELRHAGPPAGHRAIREIDGQRYFVIPHWRIGNLLVMPQMPRHAEPHAHYHDTASAPDHLYMAAYLYLQQRYGAHALIHLGTHGTQEWLPGKDRGLAASDYPWLAVGSLPVFYPYIQDNVGEAIQAKRRGRAVTVSHQTPPFAPAGLYDQLRDLHQLIHEYQQLDDGQVREQVSARIREAAVAAHLHEDLGWTAQQAEQDFNGFLQALHDQLHELARSAMPLGLHTFGQPAGAEHRASTIVQQLGEPFYAALGIDREELFVEDHASLADNPAYLAVRAMLSPEAAALLPPGVAAFTERARELDRRLRDTRENEALLAGLAGRFVPPGAGGDPIRNPEVESGRNLYAFEADKIPARAAYESAAVAYEQLVSAFRAEHAGAWPQKLAFSLWSSEAIRHLGVTEAQILHALGLRPRWDAGGRVTALEVIPARELGRPRSDVVVQVTGVYRDQFDSFMRLLDDALARLAELDEPGNPVAANNRRIAAALRERGMPAGEAAAAARYRIFGNAPGEYGTGVPDLALRSTEWDDDDALARQFLASSRHAYGSRGWGEAPARANLLAEQLRGTQAAVMARSSNVHGVLSTDHPFEFLGGLSAAIRHLDGQAPQLLVSDLRGREVRTTGLARFLADEMRVRYLNPQWIAAMQQEGYAGTLQVLNVTNNLFGWQAMDTSTVRADQWQALFDTYVTDTRALGTREWFEQHNPTAQAQILERMAEAIRKGYWDASADTRRALAQRWQELARQHGVATGAETTRRFIDDLARGFGLDTAAAPDAEAAPVSSDTPDAADSAERAREAVQGQVLEALETPLPDDSPQRWALAAMLLLLCAGGLRQAIAGGRAAG